MCCTWRADARTGYTSAAFSYTRLGVAGIMVLSCWEGALFCPSAGVMEVLWGPPSRYGGFLRAGLAGGAASTSDGSPERQRRRQSINHLFPPGEVKVEGEKGRNQKSPASLKAVGGSGARRRTPAPFLIRPSPHSHCYLELGLASRGGISQVRSYPAPGLLIGCVRPRTSRRG